MNKSARLFMLLLLGVTACASHLSRTEIESAKSPDPVPDLHKIYLLPEPSQDALMINSIFISNKGFGDAFAKAAASCQIVEADSLEERWKIVKEAKLVATPEVRSAIFKTDHDKMESFQPDAVFHILAAAQTWTHQGYNASMSITFNASLNTYPADKPLWKGVIELHPANTWDTSRNEPSPSDTLAQNIVQKLSADGVLSRCPVAPSVKGQN